MFKIFSLNKTNQSASNDIIFYNKVIKYRKFQFTLIFSIILCFLIETKKHFQKNNLEIESIDRLIL